MLAGSVSSLQHAPANVASGGIPLQPLDLKFAQMARVFDIASEATKARNTKSGTIAKAPGISTYGMLTLGVSSAHIYMCSAIQPLRFYQYKSQMSR